MNHRRKKLKRLEKRLGRRGKERHDEGEGGLLEEQATASYGLGSIINDIHVDEETMEEEQKVEETDESSPASTLTGAHAMSQQGEVRRGSAQAGGDDVSHAIVCDVETDPMPPPQPVQGNEALLVEAHLVERADNAEDVREQMATLEQENMRLRNKVPLVQAEVAQENTRSKGPRRKCLIVMGVTALLITVAVVAGVSVTGGGGTFPPIPPQSPTLSPTVPPMQSPTRPPITVIPADWIPAGQILHGKAVCDFFGSSVSLSRDGRVMAVGATPQCSNRGYVGVNRYNPATHEWMQIGQELIGQAGLDNFGESVSLNGDGTILAVGAPLNDSGGTTAGQVRAYEYNSVSDHWVQLGSDILGQDSGDEFGISVSLSDAGDILAVGAHRDDTEKGVKSGSVRLFQYDRGTSSWSQLGQTLIGQAAYDHFGFSVSLNALGTIVGVGTIVWASSDAGQVSVYEYNSTLARWDLLGDPIKRQDVDDWLGDSVSLDDSGVIVAAGVPGSNPRVLVYSYDRSTLTWNQRGQTLFSQHPDDLVGFSVSLSGNGNVLGVGSGMRGQVRIFQHDSNADEWKQVGDPLNGEAEHDEDFGHSVSLSADGSVVGVGAPMTDVNGDRSGSVHAFTANDN